MTAERPGPAARIDWLDYARLAAALAVVATHYFFAYPLIRGLPAGPGLEPAANIARYGFLGVDFFFMLSGFVIMLSIRQRSASSFAASRFVRLYPAFLFSVTLTALALAVWGDPQFDIGVGQWLANLTYFPRQFGHRLIDEVYWTLAVELQFYALVFLVLLLDGERRMELFVYLWLALQAACRLAGLDLPLLGGVFPLFVIGCLMHFAVHGGVNTARAAGIVVALALAIDGEMLRARDIFGPGPAWELWLVGAMLVALAALFPLMSRWQPALPHAARIGAITYPLYLLHQNIGYILIDALAPAIGQWPARLLVAALMIALAWLVSLFVEDRTRGWWRALSARLTLPIVWLERRLPPRRSPAS